MKFIIFDIDGTLTKTKAVDDKCFINAFEETFQLDISNQKWELLQNVTDWGITEEIILREKNRYPSKEEYQLMVSTHVENLKKEKLTDPSQFQEVKGARIFFNTLKEDPSVRLGIATGAWEQSALLKLDAVGIELDDICFCNSNYHKSREAITQDVIEQLKQRSNDTPDRIIYFGDGKWDYKTCHNLGIDFIGIDHNNHGKLERLGATSVFQDYVDKDKIMSVLKRSRQ